MLEKKEVNVQNFKGKLDAYNTIIESINNYNIIYPDSKLED